MFFLRSTACTLVGNIMLFRPLPRNRGIVDFRSLGPFGGIERPIGLSFGSLAI